MKNIIILFFAFAFSQSILSQSNDNGNKNLYFKCGTLFGNKYELATSCAKKVKDKYSADFNNQYNYCSCFLTFIAKHYTYEEFNEVLKSKKDFISEIIKSKDKELIDELKICGNSLLKEIKPTYNLASINDKFGEMFVKGCQYDIENTLGINQIEFNINMYCECLSDEFTKQGLKVADIKDFKDTNSVLFNEIIAKCTNKSKIIDSVGSTENTNDVIGAEKNENINLVSRESQSKVKIKIGNISKYFTIDSGASNIAISSNLERELLLEGLIKKENYNEDENFILADGSVIKCKIIILNNIGIGNFIVNNVKIAIINNADTDLLLGKSFLDKFKKWTINNENDTLYLEKK